MSEGYIGLAPSYGVFQKQIIAANQTNYDHGIDGMVIYGDYY